MKAELDALLKPLWKLFGKYHLIIFVVVTVLFLAATSYFLLQIQDTTSQAAPTSSTITGFDQKTIDAIKQLHDSSDTGQSITLPSPRANPFVE